MRRYVGCWSLLILLVCVTSQAWAEDVVAGGEGAATVPSLAYSDSPFVQRTAAIGFRDVLGGGTGYIHPYLAVGEYFTDNFYETRSNRKSEFVTRITPGLWLSLPASPYQMVRVNTLNVAPGGLELSRFRTKGKTRLQAYGSYQADVLLHKRFHEEDQINQRAEGFFRYNLRGGLSLQLLNVFLIEHDSAGTGSTLSLDKFKSNLFEVSVDYELSPKTLLEAEYAWYTLDYDTTETGFRDRDDQRFSARVFQQFWPKTSVFLEYNFITLDYDQDVLSDSDEHQMFLGLEWQQTDKSRWRTKLGYGNKDFDSSDFKDADNFLAELQFRHRFTPKTYIDLQGSRSMNESDSVGYDYVISHKLLLRYYQNITAKLLGSANIYYRVDDYKGDDRSDDYYGAGLDMRYALTRWLNVAGGYSFQKRNSNINTNDFDKNSVYINLVFSL